MRRTNFIAVLAVALSVAACSDKTYSAGDSEKDITVGSVAVDTVAVGSIAECSYTGYSGVYNDSLYFYDEQLSYFYAISLNGEVGERRLGLGHSAKEMPIARPSKVSYSERAGQLVALGSSNDAYIYDVKDNNVRKISTKPKGDKREYSSSSAYTLWNYVVMKNDKDNFYFNVLGNNDAVDIFQKKDYFEKAAILMKVSLKDGKMTPMGRYSDYYVENRNDIWHLPYYYFDIDNSGGFYVAYQVDSLVYHYDSGFNLISAFGFQGKDMNTAYSNPGTTVDDFQKAYLVDIENTGYYYWVAHVDDYTFRSYRKSGKCKTDGLQIYRGTTLVGDVDVPHNFKVAGRVGDSYVTEINIDEKAQKLSFYKFKVD